MTRPPFFLPAAVALGLACVAGRAWPQAAQCGPMASVLAGLQGRYGEVPMVSGQMNSGASVVFVANPAGTSWTVLSVSPDGTACLRAEGSTWVAAAVAVPGVPG